MDLFNKYIKVLREEFPDIKFTAKRMKLKELNGYCTYDEKRKRFFIGIDNTLDDWHMLDILTHEFSHAVSWDKQAKFHGVSWGKAYAKVYEKAFLKFLDKEQDLINE